MPQGWRYAAADLPPGINEVAASARTPAPTPGTWVEHPWFDFFRPDYEWYGHWNRSGQPDSDYLRNRIARLTFDLKTGEAQVER
jgi:hypothetical protein